jgi:DNA ligase-1
MSRKSSISKESKIPNKYASRPSPGFSATEYPNEMMEGNDGNMYISEKRGAAKSHRWYKADGFKPARRRSIKKLNSKKTPVSRSKSIKRSRKSIKKVVKTRKSPEDSATAHPDEKMKGLDGNMYISEKRGSAKSYRWYKISSTKSRKSIKKKLKKRVLTKRKSRKNVRKSIKKSMNFDHLLNKPCADPEKVRNPETGKCISASGPKAKKLGLSKPKNDGRNLKNILQKINTKKKSLKIHKPLKKRSIKRKMTKKTIKEEVEDAYYEAHEVSPEKKKSIKKKMSKVKEIAIVKKDREGHRTMPGYKYKHPTGVAVILAKNFEQAKHNAKGWWLSEKLDGIRAYWDANEGELFTRNGNVIYAPDFFIKDLPKNVNLDGELWIGRGTEDFNLISGISRRIPYKKDGSKSLKYNPKDWEQVKYLVFDAPDYPKPYENRVTYYHNVIKKLKSPYVVPVETWPAKSNEHVIEERIRIEDMGGEGIMLRKPGSKYDKKRSSSLLKVKSFKDAEARVIGHNKGTGKYSDVLGALVMKTIKKDNDPKGMKNGVQFTMSGMNDYQRENYEDIFPIGTIITYKYFQLSKDGVPRFPSFIAIREDA